MSMHAKNKEILKEDWANMWKARNALIADLAEQENKAITNMVQALLNNGETTAEGVSQLCRDRGVDLTPDEVVGNLRMLNFVRSWGPAEERNHDEPTIHYSKHSRHKIIRQMNRDGYMLVIRESRRRARTMEVDENGDPIDGTLATRLITTVTYEILTPMTAKAWGLR